jgi:hypothetical protein
MRPASFLSDRKSADPVQAVDIVNRKGHVTLKPYNAFGRQGQAWGRETKIVPRTPGAGPLRVRAR